MGRGFIGIDASPVALQTTRERLEAGGGALEERAFTCGAKARAS
jgi:hypothetical protein